ncbi:hypothetical protein [Planococcus sp. YIM B11945]|uniref:hypothetical protein n=1 Tax=Planococcus sp. YIM B11945 TaxID=3435410 RepID=UPI003D7ED0A3
MNGEQIYMDIKEAMQNGAGRIGETEVFLVFKRIVKRQGVLCGEIKGYSDAYGNPIDVQELGKLNN